ncbi:MAG: MBOAT family protein [Oscillospiraceae bacterium]|nr:MBOAT family protein [Oscillospiraceae bacterium]
MVFSSILFLFRFMPIAFLVYYLVPKKLKNLTLLILSLIFYCWGEIRYFPIMVASIVVDYVASNGIAKYGENKTARKLFLLMSVFFNLGMLGFFKYTNFFIENINALLGTSIGFISITLPLGISFYTFQTMSYTIDVYRGKVEAEKNIIDFGAFVVLFPQLIAGPIVRYTDVAIELKTRTLKLDRIESGISTFIMGLGRKVLIANSCGALWTEVESIGFANISSPLAWLGVLAYTLQIYFDFSGYSLMAIGLGRMLGFEFPENFNYPYISRSVTEFWRRWHMTLGSWFREYVYIPLGGNRVSSSRHIFNMFVVWALTGFWHGANWNFVLWGLYSFVFLVLEKYFIGDFLKRHKIISHVYLVLLVMISWALFAVTDLGQLGVLFSRMFSLSANSGGSWIYYLRNYGVVLLLGCIFSTPIVPYLSKKLEAMGKGWYQPLRIVLLLGILVLSVAYLVDATYNPFLYFRF